MKMNLSTVDRILRVAFGLAIVVYFLTTPYPIVAAVGVILAVTGLVGFCPIYRMLRVSTRRQAETPTSS
ncbi:MAG: DUF2892 domain-containing protein [Myxococcaceae bacterium]